MSEQEPCCGKDCECNSKPAPSNFKRFVLILVCLAVGGILIYKFVLKPQPAAATQNAGFNASAVTAPAPTARTAAPVSSSMEMLASMNSLNEKAMDKDAVMVWVPAKEGGALPASILSALQSAQQTIQAKAVKMAIYQLQAGSADHMGMSAQLALPAVLVLSKGKGMGTVTGDITAEKLLQAYVASSRSGGCCPGAATPSCKPVD